MPRRRDVRVETPAASAKASAPAPTPWRLRLGDRGWVRVEYASERLLARVLPDEAGQLRVRELVLLDEGGPVTVERLRAVRLGAIERLANHPDHRAAIERRLDTGRPLDLEAASRRFAEAKTSAAAVTQAPSGGLERPPRGYGPAHYEQVARVYHEATARDEAPVLAIARRWGVPRSTAARWAKVARERDALEPYYARGGRRADG
jgi:hypothetical protein